MSEIKTLNGYSFVDSQAREGIRKLTEEIASDAIIQRVVDAIGTPVFGRVDEDNTVTLVSSLEKGYYTIRYENEDGTYADIGTLAVGVAVVKNVYDPLTATYNKRFSGDGGYRDQEGSFCTDYIALSPTADDRIFITGENVIITSSDEAIANGTYCHIVCYDENRTKLHVASLYTNDGKPDATRISVTNNNGVFVFAPPVVEGTAYIRVSVYYTGGAASAENTADVVMTINQEP